MSAKNAIIYSAAICVALFFLFYNLGDRLLWGDEAETALLAQNITKYGIPKVTDGKNVITLLGKGYDYNDDNIWVWSPWLDEYVAAASFAMLGKSTFSARLPFALIAFLSVLFLARVTHNIYHKHELTVIVMLMYLSNVAFLLHARQCRYYALIMFAQVWIIYGYHKFIAGKPKAGILHLIIPIAIQFYCNYIVVPGNILALLVSVLVIHRREKRVISYLSICFMAIVLLATPWLLYARPWMQSSYIGFEQAGQKFVYYIANVNHYILPLIILCIPVVLHFFMRGKKPIYERAQDAKSMEMFLWILLPAHLLVLCTAPGEFFRYLTPLIPAIILLGAILVFCCVHHYILRYVIVAALCLSNVIFALTMFPVLGKQKLDMPIINFVREITSDYEDRLGDVVSFFRKNATQDESVFVLDPEFPLIFYTDMRVIDGRFGVKLKTEDLPDWILSESASGVMSYPSMKLARNIKNFYRPIPIMVHDTPRHASRPDPTVHVSFTSPRKVSMTIYKKDAGYAEVYDDTLQN